MLASSYCVLRSMQLAGWYFNLSVGFVCLSLSFGWDSTVCVCCRGIMGWGKKHPSFRCKKMEVVPGEYFRKWRGLKKIKKNLLLQVPLRYSFDTGLER